MSRIKIDGKSHQYLLKDNRRSNALDCPETRFSICLLRVLIFMYFYQSLRSCYRIAPISSDSGICLVQSTFSPLKSLNFPTSTLKYAYYTKNSVPVLLVCTWQKNYKRANILNSFCLQGKEQRTKNSAPYIFFIFTLIGHVSKREAILMESFKNLNFHVSSSW